MELDHAIIADGVSNRPDGKIDIYGAGWDTIFAPQVPATHPRIALVLRLLVTPHELERPHSILVVLLAADGQELARVEAQVNPLPAEQRQLIPAGRSVGIGAVLNFVNVVFPAYGDYGIKIHWDGTEARDLRLHVSQLPPAAMPGMTG